MASESRPPEPSADGPPPVASAKSPLRRRLTWLLLVVVALAAVAGSFWAYRRGRVLWHWQQAQDAIVAEDLPEAQRHLTAVVSSQPDRAEGHFLLGRTCRRQGDHAQARQHLDEARRRGHPRGEVDLEDRLQLAESGRLGEVAGDLIRQFQAGHYEEELILEALTKGFLAQDRPHEAAKWAEVWRDCYPDAWLARLYRGRAHQLRGLLDLAIADYRQVLDARPGHPEATLWLGGSLAANGNFTEAQGHFEEYLAGHPGVPQALLGLAYCRLSRNDGEGARAAAEEVVDQEPNNVAALLLLGQVDLNGDRPGEALDWLRRAERLSPHESDILTALVTCLRRLGRSHEADACDARLKDIRRKQSRIQELTSQVQTRRGDEAAKLRHEGAQLLVDLGREEEALRWWTQALADDPRHADSHRALADYYESRGDTARAAAHRREARRKP